MIQIFFYREVQVKFRNHSVLYCLPYRLKAYNVTQLVDFICTRLEAYYISEAGVQVQQCES